MTILGSTDLSFYCTIAIVALWVLIIVVVGVVLEERELCGKGLLVMVVVSLAFILYSNYDIEESKEKLSSSIAPYYSYGRYTADDLDKMANTFNTTREEMKFNVLYDLSDAEDEWYEVRYIESKLYKVTMLFQHKRKGDKLNLGTPSLVTPNTGE